jgi:plastocyanin
MTLRPAVAFLACLLPAASLAQDRGVVSGVVRFTGTVPPAQKVPTTDGVIILHRDLLVDEKSRGLSQVAVHVEGMTEARSGEKKPVIVDQRDMLFVPRVVAVQEGRPIRFENNDLCNHAVQAHSTKNENCFNTTTPPGQPFDFTFKSQKAPVLIGCPIHGWMRAWVYVFPHASFALTDREGRFRITGIPAGKQTLVFRHADTGLLERREVEVRAGQTAHVEVEWRETPKR